MKRIILILIAINIFTFYSCEKEVVDNRIATKGNAINKAFQHFDWNGIEKSFFSVNSGEIMSRSKTITYYNPDMIDAYNQIATENELSGFVNAIGGNIGFPEWKSTFINNGTEETVVVIPLISNSKVSGLITGKRQNSGPFRFNLVQRSNLNELGNNVVTHSFYNWFIDFENLLFENDEVEMVNRLCDKLQTSTAPPPCDYELTEICWHSDSQTTWTGGMTFLPLHLDHDLDGIPNWEDQDWGEQGGFSERSGMSQEDFENFVFEHWETNFEEDYGSYDDFWDGMEQQDDDDYNDYYDFDFNEYLQDFQIWYDNWSYEHNLINDIYDFFDDIYDYLFDFFFGPDCPFFDDNSEVQLRDNIDCSFFYLYTCDEGDSWWNYLGDLGSSVSESELHIRRLSDYCANSLSGILTCQHLDNLIMYYNELVIDCEWDDPYFENCAHNILKDFLLDLFIDEYIEVNEIDPDYKNLILQSNAIQTLELDGLQDWHLESFLSNIIFDEILMQLVPNLELTAEQETFLFENPFVMELISTLEKDNYCQNLEYLNLAPNKLKDFNKAARVGSVTISKCSDDYPLYFKTCTGVFDYKAISGTYYCEINHFQMGAWSELNPFEEISACIENLCIQVPTQNTAGVEFDIPYARALSRKAFDDSRIRVHRGLENGTIITDLAGQIKFKQFLVEELKKQFMVSSSVSVNDLSCENGAKKTGYSNRVISGVCFPSATECWFEND